MANLGIVFLRSYQLSLLLLFCQVGLGCATLFSTESTSNTPINFDQYRQFEVKDVILSTSEDPLFSYPELQRRIHFELELELQAKALEKQETNPDLNIYFYYGARSEQQLTPLPYRINAQSDLFLSSKATQTRLNPNKLVVDFVDANLNELIWRGTVDLPVQSPISLTLMEVPKSIKKLITEYPG